MKSSVPARWYLLVIFIVAAGFFFRLYHISADLPISLSWSNAATQDASWYTASAVHRTLNISEYDIGSRQVHIDRPLFTWYCYLLYQITGVSYGANTFLSSLPGMASVFLIFLIFFRHYRHSFSQEAFKCALLAASALSFNYVFIAFSRVPLLYVSISFYSLLVLWIWLEGQRRPFLIPLAWAILLVGIWGLKVILAALAPALIVGHFFFRKESRKQNLTFLLMVTGGAVILFLSYFTGFLHFAYTKVAAKISDSPRTFSQQIKHLLNFGLTSRFLVRNPFLSATAFLFPFLFFTDRRPLRHRILEIAALTWFLTLFLGVAWLDKRPLRFLSLLIAPQVLLFGLALEKIYFYLGHLPRISSGKKKFLPLRKYRHQKKGLFRDRQWKVTARRSPLWDFGALVTGILGLTFLFYHFISESYRLWQGEYLFDFAPAKRWFMEGGRLFWAQVTLGLGLALIFLAFWYLFRRRWLKIKVQMAAAALGLAVVGTLGWNIYQTHDFVNTPTYSQYNSSRELPALIGNEAHLGGAYAHALTLETKMERSAIFRLEVARSKPEFALNYLQRMRKDSKNHLLGFLQVAQKPNLFQFSPKFTKDLKERGITHLALPRFNPDVEQIQQYFSLAHTPLFHVRTIYLRGWKVMLYRICWDSREAGPLFLQIQDDYHKLMKVISHIRKNPSKGIVLRLHPLEFWGANLSWALKEWEQFSALKKTSGTFFGRISQLGSLLGKSEYSPFEKSQIHYRITEMLIGAHRRLKAANLASPLEIKAYQKMVYQNSQYFAQVSRDSAYCPFALACQARSLYAVGQYQEAEKLFRRALELNPFDGQIWNMTSQFYRGWAAKKRGEEKYLALRKALQCSVRLMELYPSSMSFKQRVQATQQRIDKLRDEMEKVK